MTRDQAIEIQLSKLSKTGPFGGMDLVAAANIDALIELGLLKVEEPVSIYARALDADERSLIGDLLELQLLLETDPVMPDRRSISEWSVCQQRHILADTAQRAADKIRDLVFGCTDWRDKKKC